jgi:hypothetical protein
VPFASFSFAAEICASMIGLNLSAGCAPPRETPLMKNAGVPLTPMLFPSSMSSSIFAENRFAPSASRSAETFTPDCCAHISYDASPRFP